MTVEMTPSGQQSYKHSIADCASTDAKWKARQDLGGGKADIAQTHDAKISST